MTLTIPGLIAALGILLVRLGGDLRRTLGMALIVGSLIVLTGVVQGANSALVILNMGLVSAIMALGLNLQWGFAGLFNVGVMGFVALGGLAAVLIGMPPVTEAWAAGGARMIGGLVFGVLVIVAAVLAWRATRGRARTLALIAILGLGFAVFRWITSPAVDAIEAVNPALTGYLGGINPGGEAYRDYGWLMILAWPVGGALAAGAAWVIGKTALGLRSDYLAIATLGIAEIVIAFLKNEDWLARGVKNVIGLPRPVPYEIDLQNDPAFIERAAGVGLDPVTASTLYTKIGYSLLFTAVLVLLLVASQLALNSPWGRMMRAIRDNETAAEAMGKDVKARHLQVFVIGSAVCGIAGAMMTTLDGQLTPGSYQPLRFTFLIWVMVIVGGSGNNFGAVLGGFLIWILWVQVEPLGVAAAAGLGDIAVWLQGADGTGGWLIDGFAGLAAHLQENAQQLRLPVMGVVLLFVLRFSPRGLLPER